MGRINFGRAIKDFRGITESVELTINVGGRPFTCDLKDWEVFNLEDTCEFYKNMKFLNEKGERLSRKPWIVKYADSEDVSRVNCSADKIFDLQESTLEHDKRCGISSRHRDRFGRYAYADRYSMSSHNGKRGAGWNQRF